MQSLSSEEAEIVEKVAQKIVRFGLQLPTLFMLDAGQPFSFIGGQLLWILQPTASLFAPSIKFSQWATLLEKPAAISELRHQLEQATK